MRAPRNHRCATSLAKTFVAYSGIVVELGGMSEGRAVLRRHGLAHEIERGLRTETDDADWA